MWPQVKTRLIINSTKTALGMQRGPDDYMTHISVLILFLYLVINPRVRLKKTTFARLTKKIPVLYEILKYSL